MSLSDIFSFTPAGQAKQSFTFGSMANHEFTFSYPCIPDEKSNAPPARRRPFPVCTPSMIGMSDDECVRTRSGIYVDHPRYHGDRRARTERGVLLEDAMDIDAQELIGYRQRSLKRKRQASPLPLTCNPRDTCTFVDVYDSPFHWDTDEDEDERDGPIAPVNRVVPLSKRKKVKSPARPTRISTREIFPNPKYIDLRPVASTSPRKRNASPTKKVSSPSKPSPTKKVRSAKDAKRTSIDDKSAPKGRKGRLIKQATNAAATFSARATTPSPASPSKRARRTAEGTVATQSIDITVSCPASPSKRLRTLKTPPEVPAIADTVVASASVTAPAIDSAGGAVASSIIKNSEAILAAKEEIRDSMNIDTQSVPPSVAKSTASSYNQFWAAYYRCYVPECSRIFTDTRFIREHIRYEHPNLSGQTFRCGYSNCRHWGSSIEIIEKHQQVFPGHNGNLFICPTCFKSYANAEGFSKHHHN